MLQPSVANYVKNVVAGSGRSGVWFLYLTTSQAEWYDKRYTLTLCYDVQRGMHTITDIDNITGE